MQAAFKDEDVKNLKAFLEFIRDKASFSVSLEEAVQLTRFVTFMQQHIRNVNDHVMELISVKEPEPEAKPSKGKKAD